jgi:hypothetical protein
MSHSNQCNKLFEKCIYVCSVNIGYYIICI